MKCCQHPDDLDMLECMCALFILVPMSGVLFHVKKPGLELKKTGSVILNFPVACWLSLGNILTSSVFYLYNRKMILLSFVLKPMGEVNEGFHIKNKNTDKSH